MSRVAIGLAIGLGSAVLGANVGLAAVAIHSWWWGAVLLAAATSVQE